MHAFFALTTRGLEDCSALEIGSVPGVEIVQRGYRRIAGSAPSLSDLLALRTVDDVFVHVATWNGVGRARSALAVIESGAKSLPLDAAVDSVREVRPIETPLAYSVTASFVGKRNYTTDEIKQAVRRGVAAASGPPYRDDDREATLNVRVFVHEERAEVGVRLSKSPLHDRNYKLRHRRGALKASVAAAMLACADLRRDERVVDPCCGTGTVAIEAARFGARVWAGDRSREAASAARDNVGAAGAAVAIGCWDAVALPLRDGCADVVACNLPWGVQVAAGDCLPDVYRGIGAEICRILAPKGRAVLLTTEPESLACGSLRLERRIEISLFGKRPFLLLYGR